MYRWHVYHVQSANPALYAYMSNRWSMCTMYTMYNVGGKIIQHCSELMCGWTLAPIIHQRGLMAVQRVIGTTKRAENTANFGTVAVLVHWPKENVNIYIHTQRATFISCKNSLPKSWNCPHCVLCRLLGGKSLWKTLHFFCWYHLGEALLPFYGRGSFSFWCCFGGSMSS